MEFSLLNYKGFEPDSLKDAELSSMKEVYVCPSFSCNLRCPHCQLKNLPINCNYEKVLSTLEFLSEKGGNFIFFDLFGGEPLLLEKNFLEKVIELLQRKKFVISTNLIKLKDFHIELFSQARWINTSYNPQRFSKEEFDLWLNNLRKLSENGIKINLMNTLTKDYIEEETPERLCSFLNDYNIYSIDFDYLIGNDYPDSDKVDSFLLNLYNNWKTNCRFNIVESVKEALNSRGVFKDCSNTYTVLPSGLMKRGCAYCQDNKTKLECKLCDYYRFCNGACKLTEQCSFPKKLYERILN